MGHWLTSKSTHFAINITKHLHIPISTWSIHLMMQPRRSARSLELTQPKRQYKQNSQCVDYKTHHNQPPGSVKPSCYAMMFEYNQSPRLVPMLRFLLTKFYVTLIFSDTARQKCCSTSKYAGHINKLQDESFHMLQCISWTLRIAGLHVRVASVHTESNPYSFFCYKETNPICCPILFGSVHRRCRIWQPQLRLLIVYCSSQTQGLTGSLVDWDAACLPSVWVSLSRYCRTAWDLSKLLNSAGCLCPWGMWISSFSCTV